MFCLIFLIILSPWDDYASARRLYDQGRFAEVITDFELLLQDYPNSEITPYCMYYIANLTMDPDEAMRFYREVVDSFPGSKVADNALTRLASYYYVISDYERADSIYKKVIHAYPDGDCVEIAKEWRDKMGCFRDLIRYAVQIGAFKHQGNAQKRASDFDGISNTIIYDGKLYKVLLGRFESREEAENLKKELDGKGFVVEIPKNGR